MFEPGMRMFQVRLTRDGEDAGIFVVPALDVDDAVARARDLARDAKERDATVNNPFDDPKGLEAWVRPL